MTVNSVNFKHTTPTGIFEQSGPTVDFTVSPNPVTDKICLHFNIDKSEDISIRLFDVSGKEVLAETKFVQAGKDEKQFIDIHNFSNGFYTIQVKSSKAISSNKLIIH
jgi:large repetitive protein